MEINMRKNTIGLGVKLGTLLFIITEFFSRLLMNPIFAIPLALILKNQN